MKKTKKDQVVTTKKKLDYKFIATSKADNSICTITLLPAKYKGQAFMKTVKELKDLELYDKLSKGEWVTAKKISEIIAKADEAKSKSKFTVKKKEILEKQGYLIQKGNSYYHPVLSHISMPELLVSAYSNAVNNAKRQKALDRFWYWCCLNPNQEAARRLFMYIEKNGLHITNNGFILTYRNVNLKSKGEQELQQFITDNRTRVKTQKQSPKNYLVVKEAVGKYHLYNTKNKEEFPDFIARLEIAKYELIGENLEDAYDHVEVYTDTIYTDAHSGKFTIVMGKEVRMKRSDCDESNRTCSKGLHSAPYSATSKGYATAFGEHQIAILINPMDVVSVPGDYGGAKMRSCAYYPISTVDKPLSDNENDVLDFDQDYMDYSYDELKSMMTEAQKRKEYGTLEAIPADTIKSLLPKVKEYQNKKERIKVV